ncbi:RNA polymerase sigma factor [Bacteroides ihuae]|uniref:RNA polymerase sigma factor n=1 Tax=Bacteroides ihuae TaxID=1852362 RepID=UPI0008D9D174|nr:sigma-70 family RNA polymerase sigma factor [Bacteroides ihuae]
MYRKALHFLKDFWLKIIAHPKRINVVKEESVLGYLSAMLVHDLYDYFRKKKLDTVCLDDTLLNDLQQRGDFHVNSVENDVNMNEFREKRESIIRALPESDRQIYTLYDKHHLEIPEIAKQYSLNKNTTRNRIAGISRYIESKLKLLYTTSI